MNAGAAVAGIVAPVAAVANGADRLEENGHPADRSAGRSSDGARTAAGLGCASDETGDVTTTGAVTVSAGDGRSDEAKAPRMHAREAKNAARTERVMAPS